jgi:hypothetical protein
VSRPRFALLCLAAAVIGLVTVPPALAKDVPTIAAISASLTRQKAQTVEVDYALSRVSTDHASDVKDGTVTYYVRTPEAVYLREQNPLLPGAPVSEYSYDRGSGEYRSLGRATGRPSSGRISRGLPVGALARQDLCDPIEVSLFPDRTRSTVRLDQWVRKGVVCPTKETVDGHACWRVDILNPIRSVKKYQIWVDPAIGFCPRRFSITWNALTVANAFKDYREVAEGIWYPMTRTFDDPRGGYRMVTRVRLIAVGKVFAKDTLIIKFPSGTRVRDEVQGTSYIAPGPETESSPLPPWVTR